MLIILTLTLLLFITTSYLFNKKKLKDSPDNIIKVSILEALVCFLFILAFALEGFLPRFIFLFISVALLLITSYLLLLFQKELDSDIDWQIETIKNNIIIFFIILFPLFIFLTIFRFQNPFFQVLLSFASVGLLLMLRKPLRLVTTPIIAKITNYWQTTYALKYVVLWVFIGLFVAIGFFFDLPKQKVASFLNLSDYTTYLKFDGNPVDLKNNIKANDTLSLMITHDNITTRNLYDYHYQDNLLYLYNANNMIVVIDTVSQSIIDETILDPVFVIGESDFQFSIIKDWFFIQDDSLFLLARTGLYHISNGTYTLIDDTLISSNTDRYVENNQSKFLKRIDANTFHIYHLVDDAIQLDETIRLDVENYNNLIVISEKLFFLRDQMYYLYEDETKVYPRYLGTPFYDDASDYLYYAQDVYFGPTGVYQTPVIKTSSALDEQRTFIKDKTYSQSGIVVNDYVYLIQLNVKVIERIDVLSNQLKLTSIHNPITYEPFFVGNRAQVSYITNVKANPQGLEYLQIEIVPTGTRITIRLLEPQDLGLQLPFYSHYALWMFIPVMIALMVPITDYRKEITIFSFEKASSKTE